MSEHAGIPPQTGRTGRDACSREDERLLARFLEEGDREAQGRLMRLRIDSAFRLAMRVLGHSADAQDAVQDAFMSVMRGAAGYRSSESVRAWMMGFVVNACLHKRRERARRAKHERRSGEQRAARGQQEHDPELLDAVRRALGGLPEAPRCALWMYYAEGFTSKEVAAALGTP